MLGKVGAGDTAKICPVSMLTSRYIVNVID
jgi:hypothetical protein